MVLKKILVSVLFLFFMTSVSHGKSHNKLIEDRKARLSRVVKSKASSRKKTKDISKKHKKIQPRKKTVRAKAFLQKQASSIQTRRKPSARALERKTIMKYYEEEAKLKHEATTRITQQKAIEEKLKKEEQARIQQEVLEARHRQKQAAAKLR